MHLHFFIEVSYLYKAVFSQLFYKILNQIWISGKPDTEVKEDEEYKRVDFSKVPKLKAVFQKENGKYSEKNCFIFCQGQGCFVRVRSDVYKSLNAQW